MARAHEVLGVPPGARPDEVRIAFRRFARLHHPDRGGDALKFRAGVEAYRRLLGLAAPSSGSPEIVFHRRRRGLEIFTAAWRVRRARRHRPARVT